MSSSTPGMFYVQRPFKRAVVTDIPPSPLFAFSCTSKRVQCFLCSSISIDLFRTRALASSVMDNAQKNQPDVAHQLSSPARWQARGIVHNQITVNPVMISCTVVAILFEASLNVACLRARKSARKVIVMSKTEHTSFNRRLIRNVIIQ